MTCSPATPHGLRVIGGIGIDGRHGYQDVRYLHTLEFCFALSEPDRAVPKAGELQAVLCSTSIESSIHENDDLMR